MSVCGVLFFLHKETRIQGINREQERVIRDFTGQRAELYGRACVCWMPMRYIL